MRRTGFVALSTFALAIIVATGAVAQVLPKVTPTPAATQAAAPSRPSPPPVPAAKPTCANPDALGIGRTVEIDTTGGPDSASSISSNSTSCATRKWC